MKRSRFFPLAKKAKPRGNSVAAESAEDGISPSDIADIAYLFPPPLSSDIGSGDCDQQGSSAIVLQDSGKEGHGEDDVCGICLSKKMNPYLLDGCVDGVVHASDGGRCNPSIRGDIFTFF